MSVTTVCNALLILSKNACLASGIVSNRLSNILAKEKESNAFDILSNPNFSAIQETILLRASNGAITTESTRPFIAPVIPPMIPPFSNPSIAPLIVSQAVIMIVRGRNNFPTILATLPNKDPNLESPSPINPNVFFRVLSIVPTGPEVKNPFSSSNAIRKGSKNIVAAVFKLLTTFPNLDSPLNISTRGSKKLDIDCLNPAIILPILESSPKVNIFLNLLIVVSTHSPILENTFLIFERPVSISFAISSYSLGFKNLNAFLNSPTKYVNPFKKNLN